MLVRDLFEYDAWYSQSSEPWYNGDDQWHGNNSGNMMEEDDHASISDIITARGLIGRAVSDPLNQKHKYFEFLKHLRTKHGPEYSTRVHQKAAELARKA